MSPSLEGDEVLGIPDRPRHRRPDVENQPQPDPAPERDGTNRVSAESAALYLPKAVDLTEFDLSQQRRMAELSSAGRAAYRRAFLKEKGHLSVEQVEKLENRTAALSVLLAQQRRVVLSASSNAGSSRLAGMLGPRARRGGTYALRPKTTVPALPLTTQLWHSALMAAEIGYNAKDLGLPNGSLRFETLNPQLTNNDRTHYQRHVDEQRVERYLFLDRHDLEQRIGVLASRDDGSLWVVDGQHHTEAAIRAGIALMGYWIFDSQGWREERRVFDAFQAWKTDMGILPDHPPPGG